MGFNGIYPLVNIQKAIENGHRNSGFSHEKWVDLSIAKCERLPEGIFRDLNLLEQHQWTCFRDVLFVLLDKHQ